MYIINALGKYDIDEIDIEKDNKWDRIVWGRPYPLNTCIC
jgi:hypothetical protein